MITNERQLQMARRNAERFKEVLDGGMAIVGLDPVIVEAQRVALRNQIDDLEAEVGVYLELRSGKVRTFHIENLAELPMALISCRIASGMTQKELAQRLSLKEQQIQRYETHNYEGASFARIADVANAVGLEVPRELRLAQEGSTESVFKRAAVAGVDKAFIQRRLVPFGGARAVAERLAYVFDWNPDDLFAFVPLEMPALAGASARFKMPRRRNERTVAVYTAYAHRLAEICARAMPVRPPFPIPDDAAPMIEMIRRRGPVDFVNALETAWDLGVIVLPLSDGGQFHGAHWRINGTNVVVLKQGELSAAKWLIDLLHEMFHAAQRPGEEDHMIIEEPETSEHRRNDKEELQATWFASLVATDCKAEQLFSLVHTRSGGDVTQFKSAVVRVASENGIDAGIIANYVAHRLAMQNVSWWGTAANLQDRSLDPLAVTRDTFFRRFDFSKVDEDGLELLQLALHDEVKDG